MINKTVVFELENVSYNYPYEEEIQVLNDISLKIYMGEKVCILGANGTGKSTLLKLLCGLISPQKGIFSVFGEQVTGKSFLDDAFIKNYHKRVGFIFQNSDAQLFCSTVLEEIAFGPLQLKLPPDQVYKRIDDILKLFEIEHLKEKAPFKLSGGEKKKVAIASVLAMNPEVLILDEPTNGLDPRTQRWLVELLISLNNSGKTIITSTHNLELVQEISDRAVVFDSNHKIVLDGNTNEVLSNADLLKRVNLVDEYYHWHGDRQHEHYHIHNFKKE